MVTPSCEPAIRPTLHVIEPGDLSSVSDDTYHYLQINERRLMNWGIANENIIKVLCD